jgi:hypothetical protein
LKLVKLVVLWVMILGEDGMAEPSSPPSRGPIVSPMRRLLGPRPIVP